MKEHYIKRVKSGSIAARAGIKPGEYLLNINGRPVEDILDYRYLMADEYVELEIRNIKGGIKTIEIEKEYDDDIGLVFERPLMDSERACCNRCIFCFVDQLPPRVRSTLRYKDDDWRLSFLQGNYITLTNLSKKDVERIISMHISPLYISIHAVDPKVRSFLMGTPRAGNLMDILRKFKEGGIEVHGQMVLCPGINDGPVLDDSVERLMELWPSLRSLAVVPVGLTQYRDKLYPLKPFDQISAIAVLNQVKKWQTYCLERLETRWLFAADEFYLLAKKEIPPYDEYEEFPQLENGVGLLASFKENFYRRLGSYGHGLCRNNVELSLVTGLAAADFMNELCRALKSRFDVNVHVWPIENSFFGPTVTVAGLVTGGDIIRQLKGEKLGSALFVPKCMLKDGQTFFLDDVTIDDICLALRVPVDVVEVDGGLFVEEVMKYRQ